MVEEWRFTNLQGVHRVFLVKTKYFYTYIIIFFKNRRGFYFFLLFPEKFFKHVRTELFNVWSLKERAIHGIKLFKHTGTSPPMFLNSQSNRRFVLTLLYIFNASSNKRTRLLKMNVKNRGIVNLREKFFFNSNVRSRRLKADSVSTNSAVSMTDDDDWKVSEGGKSATSAELEAVMFTFPPRQKCSTRR